MPQYFSLSPYLLLSAYKKHTTHHHFQEPTKHKLIYRRAPCHCQSGSFSKETIAWYARNLLGWHYLQMKHFRAVFLPNLITIYLLEFLKSFTLERIQKKVKLNFKKLFNDS